MLQQNNDNVQLMLQPTLQQNGNGFPKHFHPGYVMPPYYPSQQSMFQPKKPQSMSMLQPTLQQNRNGFPQHLHLGYAMPPYYPPQQSMSMLQQNGMLWNGFPQHLQHLVPKPVYVMPPYYPPQQLPFHPGWTMSPYPYKKPAENQRRLSLGVSRNGGGGGKIRERRIRSADYKPNPKHAGARLKHPERIVKYTGTNVKNVRTQLAELAISNEDESIESDEREYCETIQKHHEKAFPSSEIVVL